MRSSLLPSDLDAALTAIGKLLEESESVERELPRVLELLDGLSPELAIIAGGQIAHAGQLYHRRAPGIFERLFSSKLSDKEQLLRSPGLEKLFIFHFDGRVREAALQRLKGPLHSPFLFVAVAWRLNDWVRQVRDAALSCARRTFAESDPVVIAQAAKILMLREHTWQRWGDERGVLWECLGRKDVTAALAQDLTTAKNGPVARILRQALRQDAIDPHLAFVASHAVQPSARAVALQTLLEGEARWPNGWEYYWLDKSSGKRRTRTRFERRPISRPEAGVVRLLEMGSQDRSSVVRRVVAQALIDLRSEIPNASEIAANMLTDKSSAVRERAAFVLRSDAA